MRVVDLPHEWFIARTHIFLGMVVVVLDIEPRASYVLAKCSAMELCPQLYIIQWQCSICMYTQIQQIFMFLLPYDTFYCFCFMPFEKDAGVSHWIDLMTASRSRLEDWKHGFRFRVGGLNALVCVKAQLYTGLQALELLFSYQLAKLWGRIGFSDWEFTCFSSLSLLSNSVFILPVHPC